MSTPKTTVLTPEELQAIHSALVDFILNDFDTDHAARSAVEKLGPMVGPTHVCDQAVTADDIDPHAVTFEDLGDTAITNVQPVGTLGPDTLIVGDDFDEEGLGWPPGSEVPLLLPETQEVFRDLLDWARAVGPLAPVLSVHRHPGSNPQEKHDGFPDGVDSLLRGDVHLTLASLTGLIKSLDCLVDRLNALVNSHDFSPLVGRCTAPCGRCGFGHSQPTEGEPSTPEKQDGDVA